mmetsp:Transcript_13919/g.30783  ORF Transcript_13919/g.30783 Transcript_13919/m.30783 type:complete len:217 (+) Transcript_13919:496-1146(+)
MASAWQDRPDNSLPPQQVAARHPPFPRRCGKFRIPQLQPAPPLHLCLAQATQLQIIQGVVAGPTSGCSGRLRRGRRPLRRSPDRLLQPRDERTQVSNERTHLRQVLLLRLRLHGATTIGPKLGSPLLERDEALVEPLGLLGDRIELSTRELLQLREQSFETAHAGLHFSGHARYVTPRSAGTTGSLWSGGAPTLRPQWRKPERVRAGASGRAGPSA